MLNDTNLRDTSNFLEPSEESYDRKTIGKRERAPGHPLAVRGGAYWQFCRRPRVNKRYTNSTDQFIGEEMSRLNFTDRTSDSPYLGYSRTVSNYEIR